MNSEKQTKLPKRKSHKRTAIFMVLFSFAILVLVNMLSSVVHTRFDLTKEGRFSLTKPTRQLLTNVEDVITVKVYLEGSFPAGFKRLRNSTQDMLDEFRSYTGNMLQYEFIDPFEGITDAGERKAIYNQLMEKGLQPQRLIENTEEYSEKVIFPGALVIYGSREFPINLLEEQRGRGAEEVLNNSISLLEYKLANAIQKCFAKGKGSIALLEGHGELGGRDVSDVLLSLSNYYLISTLNLDNYDIVPMLLDVLIIAKPQTAFTELQKFKIDQFIMNGGKVLWLVDNMAADLDSLKTRNQYMARPLNLNIEDQLFKYGLRVNDNLIQDVQCNPIPLVVGVDKSGNAQQQKLFPWLYNPVFTNANPDHPITKNMDAVAGEFASTIDTIRQKGVSKEILLSSSQYTKLMYDPVMIDMSLVKQKPDQTLFKKSFQPVAVALEGRFESVFKNRLGFGTKAVLDTIDGFELRDESIINKMIVVSDGDIIKNDFDYKNDRPMPLGFNKYVNKTFANKDFILNAIEWLLDDSGIIVARSKDVKLRLLDSERIKSEGSFWQMINIFLPLAAVLLFGLLYGFVRRKKYAT